MNAPTNTHLYQQMAKITQPEKVVEMYRNQLSRLYGDDFNVKTKLEYKNGWIYLNAPNGHAGVYRKWQIIEMTNRLVLQKEAK